jgi:hypothetical protein
MLTELVGNSTLLYKNGVIKMAAGQICGGDGAGICTRKKWQWSRLIRPPVLNRQGRPGRYPSQTPELINTGEGEGGGGGEPVRRLEGLVHKRGRKYQHD